MCLDSPPFEHSSYWDCSVLTAYYTVAEAACKTDWLLSTEDDGVA